MTFRVRRVDSDISIRTPSCGCMESGDGGRDIPVLDAVHLDGRKHLDVLTHEEMPDMVLVHRLVGSVVKASASRMADE